MRCCSSISGLFLDAFILDKVPGGNDTNMTAYLAQQDLFGMVRFSLRAPIPLLSYHTDRCRLICDYRYQS